MAPGSKTLGRFRKLLGRGKTESNAMVQRADAKLDTAIQVGYDPTDARFIENSLVRFNIQQAGPTDWRVLNVFARDSSGQLIGGLLGNTYWGWLSIGFFWIQESWRHKGLGKKLLHAAEGEAISRGCHSSQLDSFSFQAPGFYEANGYETFGTLENFPFGHRRVFLRKRLQQQ